MEKYNRLWRSFILIGLIAIAVQQLVCADFRSVILPPACPAWLAPRLIWTWVLSIALIAACISILGGVKARSIALILGVVFLLLFLLFQVPQQLSGTHIVIFEPWASLYKEIKQYINAIGSWTAHFKELSFSGAAFIVAGSFPPENTAPDFIKLLAKLIPIGKYFFAVTLILFGSMHFIYPGFCASLVPGWMHFSFFWMYFGAVALIAGGLGIMIKRTRHIAALLAGIMLFLWVLMLHIPRAIADPHSGDGNEWTSVFEALAFSGIAFIIAGNDRKVIPGKPSPHRL